MQGNSHGESRNSRADKMSGIQRHKKKETERLIRMGKYMNSERPDRYAEQPKLGSFGKKFYSKKRREFLKDRQNDDKI